VIRYGRRATHRPKLEYELWALVVNDLFDELPLEVTDIHKVTAAPKLIHGVEHSLRISVKLSAARLEMLLKFLLASIAVKSGALYRGCWRLQFYSEALACTETYLGRPLVGCYHVRRLPCLTRLVAGVTADYGESVLRLAQNNTSALVMYVFEDEAEEIAVHTPDIMVGIIAGYSRARGEGSSVASRSRGHRAWCETGRGRCRLPSCIMTSAFATFDHSLLRHPVVPVQCYLLFHLERPRHRLRAQRYYPRYYRRQLAVGHATPALALALLSRGGNS
jgi:hypothetical protein